MQRSHDDKHNPNQWEFPGGKLENGQTINGSLKREVEEETGYKIEPESKPNHIECYIIGDGPRCGSTYVATFGMARIIGGQLKLSDEHSVYTWQPYEQALEYNLTKESRNALIALGRTALQQDYIDLNSAFSDIKSASNAIISPYDKNPHTLRP